MNKRKLVVLLFILSLILLCLNENAFAEIRGYWWFEEDTGYVAIDSSTYNNHGSLCEYMDAPNCWVNGKRGGALSFDGDSDWVDCGNHSSLTITDALTIEMWVRFDAFTIQENILSNCLVSASMGQIGVNSRRHI